MSEAARESKTGRCACGSGAHPRRCEKHPDAYDEHCDEINREQLNDTPGNDEAFHDGRASGTKEEGESDGV